MTFTDLTSLFSGVSAGRGAGESQGHKAVCCRKHIGLSNVVCSMSIRQQYGVSAGGAVSVQHIYVRLWGGVDYPVTKDSVTSLISPSAISRSSTWTSSRDSFKGAGITGLSW